MVTLANRLAGKSLFAASFSRIVRQCERRSISGSFNPSSETSAALTSPLAKATATGKDVEYCASSVDAGQLVASLMAS